MQGDKEGFLSEKKVSEKVSLKMSYLTFIWVSLLLFRSQATSQLADFDGIIFGKNFLEKKQVRDVRGDTARDWHKDTHYSSPFESNLRFDSSFGSVKTKSDASLFGI